MAPLQPRSPKLAVDTNFLIGLAIDAETSVSALEVIRKRLANPAIIVPPTVSIELAVEAVKAPGTPVGKAAARAIRLMLREWRFQPVNLVPVGHGIVDLIAGRILERGYIPSEERNDAHILSETALLGCALLITSDAHLLGIPPGPLRLLLEAHDVGAPVIVSPRKLVREFFR
jgi:hypothetical protein